MEPKTATPFVYWAQSQEQIFLRFELEAKSQPNVSTSESELSFSCDGTAPTTGHRRYCVVLSFHDDIVPGSSGYRMEVMGSKIQFYLEKAPEKQYFWPHLLKNRAKPAWLKIDFDRFQSGDADTDEEKHKNLDPDRDPSMKNTVDELLKGIKDKKPGGFAQPGLDFKRTYLTAYNTFMLLGFFGIFVSLLRNVVSHGTDFFPKTYSTVGFNVRIMQYAQVAEVFHAAFGLVRSKPLTAVLQTVGRLAVLHMIVYEPYLQSLPAVFWLFLCWSTVELIRYPYYLCQIHGHMPDFLKTLRYTTWMVLYPAGMLLETVIMIRAIETYPLSHPSPLFHVADYGVTWAHFIGVYLCLFPVACLFLLRHMFLQTKSQLFGKSAKKRAEKIE